ncbi:MAG: hypothetical protein ABIJ16_03455, partial [Bacteroidota bacterium]
ILLIFCTFISCNEGNNGSSGNADDGEIYPDTNDIGYIPINSEKGIKILDKLASSEFGWRSDQKYDGKYTYMNVYQDEQGIYHANWGQLLYDVYFEEDWISFFRQDMLYEGYADIGECYSLHFQGKDSFEICHVHMCAVIKDEYWDTYVRNEETVADDGVLDYSTYAEDIQEMIDKTGERYICCEDDGLTYTQSCVPFRITKTDNASDRGHQNFWIDLIQDGYEFEIQSVSYDPQEPGTIIFHSKTDLEFTTVDGYKAAFLREGNYSTTFMIESDYNSLPEPPEPCIEEGE